MSLTPEMEALVPEVSRELFKALTGGRAGKPKLIDLAAARAIIPLIYTAGLRAGREEAAVYMNDRADQLGKAGNNPSTQAMMRAIFEAEATAIRGLSEQEKSRG